MKINKLDSVASPVAFVVNGVNSSIIESVGGDLNAVFDPDLGYESALSNMRMNSQFRKSIGSSVDLESGEKLPILAFNRTPLRLDKETEKRGIMGARFAPSGSADASLYSTVRGEFGMDFLFISSEAREMEAFELLYLAEFYARETTKVLLVSQDAPSGQDLTLEYLIRWEEIDSISFNKDSDKYYGLGFSCIVSGVFAALDSGIKLILDPKATVKT